MLHPLLILSLVLSTVRPLFNTLTVLFVLEPLSFISAAVVMGVNSVPVGLVVSPLSLVDVAFGVHEAAVPVSHPLRPEAVVARPIRPDLDSASILLIIEPFSLVDGPVLKSGNSSDVSGVAVHVIVGHPVEGLELLYDVHHYRIVVRGLADLEELVYEHLLVCSALG